MNDKNYLEILELMKQTEDLNNKNLKLLHDKIMAVFSMIDGNSMEIKFPGETIWKKSSIIEIFNSLEKSVVINFKDIEKRLLKLENK